ncbi:MAG: hypothetical protein H0T89_35480 [Deltaproteobacteria bacterium]|nr:hypothetical protein [Deltaproteobacteria bacterium]
MHFPSSLVAATLLLSTPARAEPAWPCRSELRKEEPSILESGTIDRDEVLQQFQWSARSRTLTVTGETKGNFGKRNYKHSGRNTWVLNPAGLPESLERVIDGTTTERQVWRWQGGVLRRFEPASSLRVELGWPDSVKAVAPGAIPQVEWMVWMDDGRLARDLYPVLFAGASGTVDATTNKCESLRGTETCEVVATTRLTFDARGNLVDLKTTKKGERAPSHSVSLIWRDGRLESAEERTERSEVHRWSYDAAGRLVGRESVEKRDDGNHIHVRKFSRDRAGRVTTMMREMTLPQKHNPPSTDSEETAVTYRCNGTKASTRRSR